MQESEFIQLSHTKVDNTKYGRYTGIQGERKKRRIASFHVSLVYETIKTQSYETASSRRSRCVLE